MEDDVNIETETAAVPDTLPDNPDNLESIVPAAGGARREIRVPGSRLAETAAQESDLMGLGQKIGITIAIVAGQALLIWLVQILFKKISARVKADLGNRIKPLTIRNLRILSAKQIIDIFLFLLNIAKYLVMAFQLFITVPIIFSLYPETKNLASTIFGYILTPLQKILLDAVGYLPNVITIVIILVIVKYVLRALKFFATQISKEKLVIPGFYTDWAWPTYNLLKVLLCAFTVAMVYPYLPGSQSRIFQGVSVFVGIIISLGSSSAIGNLVAGLVITYMRPFVIGDRIEIKDVTGFVVEKSPFVIRIRNTKNEYITFPNLTVLNSEVTNYSTSAEDDELVLHTKITVGYDVPWRQVHDILIEAASKTPTIEERPKPYVLQTALDDFYAVYEINAYTKDVEHFQRTYSLLYQNIQDTFTKAGISLTSPHFEVGLPPPKKQ